MTDLAVLEDSLGVSFKEPALLETALVHSSYVNEKPGLATGHNERLEFLGDAILGSVIAEKLFRDSPALSEGEMTRLRAALVRRETLARAARAVRLGAFLRMGKGEEASGGRDKTANLAGALEAVIAAAYLDRGAAAARRLILKLLADELAGVTSQGTGLDEKSQLQEVLQSRLKLTPAYRLLDEAGPGHDKRFTVAVMAGDRELGRGTGRSKKLAETEAARRALRNLAGGFTG